MTLEGSHASAAQAGVPALASGPQRGAASPPLLVKWLCLSLGRLVEDQADLIAQVSSDALSLLSKLLLASHPEVRAAAVFALSICIQVSFPLLLGILHSLFWVLDFKAMLNSLLRQSMSPFVAHHMRHSIRAQAEEP